MQNSKLQRLWNTKVLLDNLKLEKILMLVIALWFLSGIKLQAQAENNMSPPVSSSNTELQVESSQETSNTDADVTDTDIDTKLRQVPVVAIPESFKPELNSPVTVPKPNSYTLNLMQTKPAKLSDNSLPTPESESKPDFSLEGIQVNFQNDSNSERNNVIIEPTLQFSLPDDQKLRVKTGFNTFEQRNIDTVTNIPIQLGWEGKIGEYKVQAGGGVDIFNRLPTAINLNAKVEAPIYVNLSPEDKLESGLFVSGFVEQGPYKFNAKTLENQITAWRFGPNVYWQIDPKTSFYAHYRQGLYNDGNSEKQIVSRLERKLGNFFVAANLFNWSYASDNQNSKGYFSPPDFLVYNGEVGWEGNISESLRCRVTTNLGQQRLTGNFSNAFSYEGRCTAKISKNIEADFGYGSSNVRQQNNGANSYNNQSISGQLRMNF
ncbi:MAG: hypothetical protein KME64_40380 [Scytonematopsis contorta HA4267-MV1]|jgi:hypothetical protein|nr:hypothetical protein [Scytonematopsis contorta HA4267-MV1]